jgi:magnesium transporter
MRSWIETEDGCVENPSDSFVQERVAAGEPLWLDIEDPTNEVIDRLATRLDLHPLAVDDSKTFDQTGKLQIYGDVAMLVGFGLDRTRGEPLEVHAYCAGQFVITLHRGPCPAFEQLHEGDAVRAATVGEPGQLLHELISALHDDYGPHIDHLDEGLSRLAGEVLSDPDDRHLIEIAEINQQVAMLRRAMTPGRDLAARTNTLIAVPGFGESSQPYIEDLYDELQRIVSELEELEQRGFALLGLHVALASNRQSITSRQLAVVATIFLPITFLASYFGQNFAVLTETVQVGWPAFVLLGVGLYVVCVMATIRLLRRRGLD